MPGGTDPPSPGQWVALALGGRAAAAAPKCESWRLWPRGRARGREAARLAPHSYSHPTGPARWQRALWLSPHPGACLLLPHPVEETGSLTQAHLFPHLGSRPEPCRLVCGRCPLREAEEPAAGCHSPPHPTREGGDPDPSWDGISPSEREGDSLRPVAKSEAKGWVGCGLRAGFPPPPVHPLCLSSLQKHPPLAPDCTWHDFASPWGWGGVRGEGLPGGLPWPVSPLPPAWTNAGIEGQDSPPARRQGYRG